MISVEWRGKYMKVTNIQWDVEKESDFDYLPNEIEVPDYLNTDEIDDYISDVTGFCHNGYVLEN